MRLFSLKLMVVLMLVSTIFSACVTSRIKPVAQGQSSQMPDSSDVKIFLLERDIPSDIEQLGVVTIRIESGVGLRIDEVVKQQLRDDCQKLGANGAYRINDGTYYPVVVNYLAFRYKK
jgi:hypothetical protein